MDRNKLKHFEELLIEEKNEREKSLFANELGKDVSLRDATSELSSYDNHPGDMGTETFESELNQSFRINDKYMISEIDVALHKIKEGSYGECEACHKNIEEDRLEIIPHARFCIICENSFEQKVNDQENREEAGRPIEEQVINTLGYSFRDMTMNDELGYDGEDTWQDLNEYNVKMSDNNFDHEDSFGYVEDVDSVSNRRYKSQVE
jgi:YteA family regulatory protein